MKYSRQLYLDGFFHVETAQLIQVQQQNCNTNAEYHFHPLLTHTHPPALDLPVPKCGKKASPYSITERRVPELIPVLGCQPADDASHKLGGRLPLLSARPAVTPTTLKRAATNFAAW